MRVIGTYRGKRILEEFKGAACFTATLDLKHPSDPSLAFPLNGFCLFIRWIVDAETRQRYARVAVPIGVDAVVVVDIHNDDNTAAKNEGHTGLVLDAFVQKASAA